MSGWAQGSGKSTVLQCFDFLAQQCKGDIQTWLDTRHWSAADLNSRLSHKSNIDFTVDLIDNTGQKMDWVCSFNRSELKQQSKSLKPFSRRGKKTAAETRFFFNNARAMAQIAIECQQSENVEILAILFRDSDDATSCGRGLWQEKHQSMLDGFTREKFLYGVPMVPKPISEAWLLCALRERYQHCDGLENESGRCGTANPLKKQL